MVWTKHSALVGETYRRNVLHNKTENVNKPLQNLLASSADLINMSQLLGRIDSESDMRNLSRDGKRELGIPYDQEGMGNVDRASPGWKKKVQHHGHPNSNLASDLSSFTVGGTTSVQLAQLQLMNAFIPGLGKSDERLTQMQMEQREP